MPSIGLNVSEEVAYNHICATKEAPVVAETASAAARSHPLDTKGPPMLFLGFESAVQYWRTVRANLIPFPEYSQMTAVVDEDCLLKVVRDAVPDLPICEQVTPQVLVSQMKLIHKSKKVDYHLCDRILPKGSFFRHTFSVRVASPELCLLQAASDLGAGGFITLLELCCEFMGRYTLCEGTKRGFLECEPLLTRDRMEEYLDYFPKRTRGADLLRRAIDLVGEDSRSPRETECFLALTLPPKLGGFGLPKPKMNPPVPLEDEDDDSADGSAYYADLMWEDKKVIFEYDGGLDHSEDEAVKKDKERRSVLASLGYYVVVAFKESVSDDERFKDKVEQVFRALDIPMPAFSEKARGAQSSLRDLLFDPMHHLESDYITPITPKIEGEEDS